MSEQPKIIDKGTNNSVIGSAIVPRSRPNGEPLSIIEFRGKNCSIEFGPDVTLRGVNRIIFYRNNQHVRIMGSNALTVAMHLKGAGTSVLIGRGTSSNGAVWMNLGEPDDRVVIGEDCLLETNVAFRTSHSHPIFDLKTGERLNPSASIVIADRVWIDDNVTLLGGSSIGQGSVIQPRSLVRNAIPPDCLASGVPAKIIRDGIRWGEKSPTDES